MTMSYYPDKDRPSTWKLYKQGMCEGCNGNCCTMPVEITREDLVLMGLADPDPHVESDKKVYKRLSKEGILKSYRAGSGLFMLMQKSNDDCIYLDQNRLCKIYELRPQVCRMFPSIGPRPGFCPQEAK